MAKVLINGFVVGIIEISTKEEIERIELNGFKVIIL